jgi:hypothetical protein
VTEEINLKALEKRIWRFTYQDGLWDIFFGLLISGYAFLFLINESGLGDTFNLMIFLICWNTIPILILSLGKKYLIPKRIGSVKFGQKRQKTKKRLVYFLVANVVIGLILMILTPLALSHILVLEGLLVPLFIGLIFISLPLSILAVFLDYRRLYIYAIIFGLGFTFTEVLFPLVGTPMDFIISFGLPGGIISFLGFYLLISFLKKYPKE